MSTGSFQRIGVAANLDKEQALALVPDILPALASAICSFVNLSRYSSFTLFHTS